MTLAEFYTLHRSPQAIIVPRRIIRVGAARSRSATVAAAATEPSAVSLPAGDDAPKKH